MKKVKQFEIINHGVEHSQYFQGCGVSLTKYDECATGTGNSYKEALNDALESLAQNEWEVSEDLEQEVKDADDHNYVSDVLKENFPAVKYRVKHVGYCGMVTVDEYYDDESDAREFVAELLQWYRKKFKVSKIDAGKYEIEEPENSNMVPDQCGTLSLTDNSEEVEKEIEEMEMNSELTYYVSVIVSDKEE